MLSFADVNEVKKFVTENDIEFISFYLGDIDGRLEALDRGEVGPLQRPRQGPCAVELGRGGALGDRRCAVRHSA